MIFEDENLIHQQDNVIEEISTSIKRLLHTGEQAIKEIASIGLEPIGR
ncbi:MAG: hypothetical protein Sylvanvirus29_11, partial [Sylvanvirus sp.]